VNRNRQTEPLGTIGKIEDLPMIIEESESANLPWNAELERVKLDALAEFAAGAGHEINNPLAIISGHAQLLLQEISDPDQRRHLTTILAQTRRAYEMIADIRLFARPPLPQWERVVWPDFFAGILRRIRNDYPRLQLCPEENEKVSPVEFLSDTAQLTTIILALVRNASEAVWEGTGHLYLNGTPGRNQQGMTLELVVEDDGPGIPPAIQEQMFSPYFSGRQAGRGLGFGLPKVWRFVKNLGGTIKLTPSCRFQQGCRWLLEFNTEPQRCRTE